MKTTDRVSRKAEETMTSTDRCGPLLCEGEGRNEGGADAERWRGERRRGRESAYLQVGAEREPHLDVLHLLESEVRDLGLAGSAGRREVAKEFGEQQPLKQTGRGQSGEAADDDADAR